MLQNIIVFAIVAAAAAYLVRSIWRTLNSRRACGGCGGACGGKVTPNSTQNAPQLVQIQMKKKS